MTAGSQCANPLCLAAASEVHSSEAESVEWQMSLDGGLFDSLRAEPLRQRCLRLGTGALLLLAASLMLGAAVLGLGPAWAYKPWGAAREAPGAPVSLGSDADGWNADLTENVECGNWRAIAIPSSEVTARTVRSAADCKLWCAITNGCIGAIYKALGALPQLDREWSQAAVPDFHQEEELRQLESFQQDIVDKEVMSRCTLLRGQCEKVAGRDCHMYELFRPYDASGGQVLIPPGAPLRFDLRADPRSTPLPEYNIQCSNWPSIEMGSAVQASLERCRALCLTSEQCKGFSYLPRSSKDGRKGDGLCRLAGGSCHRVEDSGWDFYPADRPAWTLVAEETRCGNWRDIGVSSTVELSVTACGIRCLLTAGCASFNYKLARPTLAKRTSDLEDSTPEGSCVLLGGQCSRASATPWDFFMLTPASDAVDRGSVPPLTSLDDVAAIWKGDGFEKLRFDRCALVGGSDILVGSGQGGEIESHSAVIRINRVPTSEFRDDVGSRTDVLFVNNINFAHGLVDQMARGVDHNWTKCSDVPSCRAAAVIASGNLACSPQGMAGVWGRGHAAIGCQHPNSTSWSWSFETLRDFKPTTGFQAFLTFLPLCSELTLFGFGGSGTADGHEQKEWHNLYLEHDIIRQIADGKWDHLPWNRWDDSFLWLVQHLGTVTWKH